MFLKVFGCMLHSDTEMEDATCEWAALRLLWPKQMICLAQVNTFTKYPKLLERTPSSSQQHILWPLWGRALWSEKKSTGCPFESGHYRCFNLWHWQVRKIPWPEPERVVAGKVRSTIGEKLLGEEGKTLILKPGPLVLSAFLPFQD